MKNQITGGMTEGGMTEKIQLASELIFAQILEEEGLNLDGIKQKIEWVSPLCDWALGYLAGIGDIEITGRDGAIHVQRKISHYPFLARTQE